MKKIVSIMVIAIITMCTVSVFANGDINNLPDLPSMPQSHYVIYKEGSRGVRIEVAFFDIATRERQAEQGLGDVIKDKFSVDYQTELLSVSESDNNEDMLNFSKALPFNSLPEAQIPSFQATDGNETKAFEESVRTVTFSIDNTTATVNGETKTMDVPARLIGDQTFVPLRFLSENLGYTVTWDDATQTAKVLTK